MMNQKIIPVLAAIATLILGAMLSPASLAEFEISVKTDGERATAKQVSAVITNINYDSRNVTLEGPLGNTITMTASDDVERFGEFNKGDFVMATYISSMSGEVRSPTEEELALPWVELDAAAIAAADVDPGAAVGQFIRAVVTVEGMNRVTRTVTVLDSRGNFHIIDDVNPEKMEGVALGDSVIIVYSQAVVLTLERVVTK